MLSSSQIITLNVKDNFIILSDHKHQMFRAGLSSSRVNYSIPVLEWLDNMMQYTFSTIIWLDNNICITIWQLLARW
jgi:hypothetical protein